MKKTRYYIEYLSSRRRSSRRLLNAPPAPYAYVVVTTSDPGKIRKRRSNKDTALGVVRPKLSEAAAAVQEILGIAKEDWQWMVEEYRTRKRRRIEMAQKKLDERRANKAKRSKG